jgi:large subunit ribosomal protein L30
MASLIKVTLKRGFSGADPKQVATVRGLGVRKVGHSAILKDTAPIRGMIMKVQHMLDVERFDGDDKLRDSARIRKRAAQAS